MVCVGQIVFREYWLRMTSKHPQLPQDLEADILALIHDLADASRVIAHDLFRTDRLETEDKEDESPVTIADKRIETAWREQISAKFPDHGILGEEFDEKIGDARVRWVLDPIDGTRQFVYGMPLFGSLIGVMVDDDPLIGCIDIPMTGERWIGTPSTASTMNGSTNQTASTDTLANARMMATAPAMFVGDTREPFSRLTNMCKDVRFGTDCYAYGLLALGHCDLVAEASMKPMDIMALVPIVHQAGGVVTDWQGAPCTIDGDGTILASANPMLHARALAALRPSIQQK